MHKKSKWTDLIVIVLLIIIGLGLLAMTRMTAQKGKTVRISIDREVVKTMPLDRDDVYMIHAGDDGENTVIIENNTVRIDSANCPDELCVHMGKIGLSGQSIICLPHKAVVEITSEDGTLELDGVTG